MMTGKYKLLLVLALLFSSFSIASAASINVSFGPGTPLNDSTQTSTSIYVNLSVNASADHYSFIDFDNDLLLWMRMDDVNASGDPVDLSSHGNNGTKKSGAVINSTNGYFGNGTYFDGVNDNIDLGDTAGLNLTGSSFTLSSWINPAAAGHTGFILSKADSVTATRHYGIMLISGVLNTFTENNDLDSSGVTPLVGSWTHVVMTWNGTRKVLYVNGTYVNDWAGTPLSVGGQRLLVSCRNNGAGVDYCFNGTIDEVMIFNRSLSAGEIQSLYNSSEYSYAHNFAGLSESVHTFTGYGVNKSGDKNQTEARVVTVTADVTLPNISLVYPQNTTYHHNVSTLNYTASDENIGSCWYSINNGTINSSAVSCGTNFTGITSVEGSNTWTVWANDSVGNENSSSITFTKEYWGEPITGCQTISASGTYYLANDITPIGVAESRCIDINAGNVIIDGKGSSVVNLTYLSAYAFDVTSQTNVTIKNMPNITLGSGTQAFRLVSTVDVTLENITINQAGYWVVLSTSDINFTLKDSSLSNALSYGVYGVVTGATIEKNTFSDSTKPAIRTSGVWSGVVIDNNVFENGVLSSDYLDFSGNLTNVNFTNNIFRGFNASGEIGIVDADSSAYYANEIYIYNNSFYDNNLTQGAFFDFVNGENITILNNTFGPKNTNYNIGYYNIYLHGNMTNAAVYGNDINCTGRGHGIMFGGGLDTIQGSVAYGNVVDSCSFGILFHGGSVNNTFREMNVTNSGVGFYVITNPVNNTAYNLKFDSCTYGIRFYTDSAAYGHVGFPSGNLLYNIIINNSGTDGLNFRNVSDGGNTVKDVLIENSGASDITAYLDSTNLFLVNASYDKSKTNIQDTSSITRKWYYRTNATNSSGSAIENANVSIYNVSGNMQFSSLTDSGGLSTIYEIIDYVNLAGTRYYYSNYTINVSASGYENSSVSYNATAEENNLLHGIILDALSGSAPNWALNQTGIVITYSLTTLSLFNITWTDDGLIDTVYFESNYSGSSENYTMSNATSDVYNYSAVLPAGTFYWKSHANDTSNLWNSTDSWIFTISQASSEVNLTLNETEENITINEGDSINLNATLITGEGSIKLYNNGTLINSGSSPIGNSTTFDTAGFYNITAIYESTQNYSSSFETYYVNVTDITPPLVSFENPTTNSGNYNQNAIWVNVTASDVSSSLDTIKIWLYNSTGLANSSSSASSSLFVNFTNLPDETYYLNATANDTLGNLNNTETKTIILDNSAPGVSIANPSNNTNTTDTGIDVNYTASDTYLQTCWYSNDTMSVNTTLANCANVTAVVWSEGQHNVTVWANDTAGNENSSSVTFYVDTTFPQISVIYPESTAYNVNVSGLNYSASDASLSSCWYSINGGGTNTSVTCGENVTGLVSSEGSNTWTVWANDSAGKENSSSVTFTKDTGYPLIEFGDGTSEDGVNVSRTWIYVNVSVTEGGEDAIVFVLFNTTSEVNTTLYTDATRTINWTGLPDETYYYNVTVNDTSGNSNSTETRTIVLDTVYPTIGDVANISITTSSAVINWTTDELANSTVDYGSTVGLGSLETNSSFVLGHSVQLGGLSGNTTYHYNVSSCDYAGNCNTTGTYNFTTLAQSVWNVSMATGGNQSTNTETNVTYQIKITNEGNVADNYTLFVTNTNSAETAVLNQSSVLDIGAGSSANVTLTVGDSSSGNYTVSVNAVSEGNSSVTSSLTTITDVLSGPVISSTEIYPFSVQNGTNVSLYVLTANGNYSWASVAKPDGNWQNVTLANGVNTNFTNTSLLGRYNVTFYVNDSYGAEVNSSPDYFESFAPVLFNISVLDYNLTGENSTINVYYRGQNIDTNLSESGNYSRSLPNTLVDLEVKAQSNRLQVYLRDINLSSENSETLGMDRHTSISRYLVTYGVNTTYNFTNSTVRIYYDDLTVTTEGNLELYKCDDYAFSSRTCSGTWTDISDVNTTQNTTGDYFEHLTTSFSGFSILETAAASTTEEEVVTSSGGTPPFWRNTFMYDFKEFREQGFLTKELRERYRIKVKIDGAEHYAGVVGLTKTQATINVSSESQQEVFNVGEEKKFEVNGDDFYDILIVLNSISDGKANVTISYLHEEIPKEVFEEGEAVEEIGNDESGFLLVWIFGIAVLIIVIILAVTVYFMVRRNKKLKRFMGRQI